ncbi:peptidoglycan bridge formation glycyltransferase FemA/FemB family protein [Furfurilactobacillus sp. WILCCON 0119]
MLTTTELSESEFMTFEQTCANGCFYQTSWQRQLLADQGNITVYLGLRDDTSLVMAALLVGRKIHFGYRFEVYGGPVFPKDALTFDRLKTFLECLTTYAYDHEGLEFSLLPNLDRYVLNDDGEIVTEQNAELIHMLEVLHYRYTDFTATGYQKATHANHFVYKKTLSGLTAAELTASYSKATRYNINKAKEVGVELRQLTFDELAEFKNNTEATAERLHFKDKPLSYYQSAFQTYGDHVKFMVAELNLPRYMTRYQDKIDQNQHQIAELAAKHKAYNDKKIAELERQNANHHQKITQANTFLEAFGPVLNIAGAMFISQPQEMDYVFSYTNETFKAFRGPFLLQDTMMHEAAAAGIPTYNFLGIAGQFDGNDGVFEFKRGFNGYPTEILGEFTKIIRPAKHQMLSVFKELKQLVS